MNEPQFDPPHPAGLMNEALPSAWGSPARWLTMSDGAAVWYTESGAGRPLVLVHGWRASSRFWLRNVPELSRHCRVIVPELRGHGSSAKVLHGHTIARYAEDLHELCCFLGLERPVLAGWSMSGSVCMEYWRRYGAEQVGGLVLIDSNLAPFADEAWNAFRMKDRKSEAHNESIKALTRDPEGFARQFAAAMFGEVPATEAELDWMTAEMTNTPPWIAAAVHSDFVVRNYERVIPSVTVPAAVFSGVFEPGNLEMGEHFARSFAHGRYHAFEHCGHLLFYEDPDRFNREMIGFMEAVG